MTREQEDLQKLANARIVVVEDENIIAKDIAESLRGLGYEVCGLAGAGRDAVRLAEETQPDLVLMDVRLKGDMDGIEAAKIIREKVGAPVVFLTAYADEKTLERAEGSAPYGYVLKPFDDRELHVAIVMALCKHRAFMDLDRMVQERTDQLLRSETRFRRISAVAELGLYALSTRELQDLMDRAAGVACETLGTESSLIMELSASGTELVVRAGNGWEEGIVGSVIPLDPFTTVGHTLATCEPVMLEDVTRETRFRTPELLREHGVIAGLSVVIQASPTEGRAYGVLSTHSSTRRPFTADDSSFLQAVSNVVATAIARTRTEEQLVAAERRAEHEAQRLAHAQEAIRLRDEFLSIASHELRTPLTALQLQLQSLGQRLDAIDDTVARKVERATRSTERLATLVENLLDVSRLSTGRMLLQPQKVDLAKLVREEVDRVRPEAARDGCELTVHATDSVEAQVDPFRIEQVLANLLSNAIKYGRGAPIGVTLDSDDGAARITVTDHGPGIDPRDMERIFKRFERAASARNYGGLGLGLYISREIVDAHGGTIKVVSELGRGATFIVELPLELAESTQPVAEHEERATQ